MLINTYLDTEDFVHLYYPEDEPASTQGCGAGARMASKYPPRPPSPDYEQVAAASSVMNDRERYRAPPQPEPPPHRVRAADLYPRLRTHYDEPGVEAGFTPICGEFIQWVGRTSDGGTVAMSNYRLHLQPKRRGPTGVSVPLRLIDALEIRDTLCLIILCKHGRQLKCLFNTGEQCLEWCRRLTTTALTPIVSLQETFAATYAAWAKEQPPSSVHRALMRASQTPQRHWFGPEVERLGFSPKGPWRVTAANAEYKLCPSYPPLLIVPASVGDDNLESVARFRAMRRIPAVVWRHRVSGAVIARSSQPEVGWFGARSSEDERLLAAFVSACNADRTQPIKNPKLLIVDARSYTSAVTNRARGGGCEYQQYYTYADIQFMSLPNIHHVRRSYQQIRQLAAEPSDQPNWHSNLERTLWLQNLSDVLRAACVVARAVEAGCPVLVHCSDGWDRTPQLSSAAQLLLDPYYRTRQGFRVLIEREWLDFGHKFGDRCGHQFGGEDPNERSPIFLQWLHVVYQLVAQFPCSFELNEAYLIKLATHVHSCMFGTFLCNSGRERAECGAGGAPLVWHLLTAPAYRNHLYAPANQQQVLWPECSVRAMQVWWELFSGECRGETDGDIVASVRDLHADTPLTMTLAEPSSQPHNGVMTKTRSCDNLLCEGEKRTTQRRCSDPSLAPDVMKLSVLMNGLSGSEERVSPVSLPRKHAQVEVHPEHFESHTEDITSNSSSLERELAAYSSRAPDVPVVNVDALRDATDAELANGTDVPDGSSPDADRNVFDLYTDVFDVPETTREANRTRNISITWRSVSESSNQSSTGFDIPENSPQNRINSNPARIEEDITIDSRTSSDRDTPIIDNRNSSARETPTIDKHNSTEADLVNHNVVHGNTNHNRQENGVSNGLEDVTAKFLDVELNGVVSSSGASSESEGEGRAGAVRGRARDTKSGRGSSMLTLCPASPRRPHCRCAPVSESHVLNGCWCGVCTSGAACEAGETGGARARCVCGAGAGAEAAAGAGAGAIAATSRDELDGLPPAADAVQGRLHQIILYQKKVVEELSGQLREAREALRRASPALPAPPQPARPDTVQLSGSMLSGSGSGSVSGSSSGSASEVEVGEEARGVVWLPDSAAPRCQHCRNQFWLARRRHHCRRCGGIFCGSCSEMSSWGEIGSVRVCRRCRAMR